MEKNILAVCENFKCLIRIVRKSPNRFEIRPRLVMTNCNVPGEFHVVTLRNFLSRKRKTAYIFKIIKKKKTSREIEKKKKNDYAGAFGKDACVRIKSDRDFR